MTKWRYITILAFSLFLYSCSTATVHELKSPGIVEPLVSEFDRMETGDATARLQAKQAAERIVYQSTRPGAREEQAAAEVFLLGAVKGAHKREVKDFAYRLISLVGGKESVAVLSERLDVPEEREMARWALERIPDPSATKAVADALRNAREPEWKAALVKTLGARKDPSVSSAVVRALSDENESVRLTAIAAAGRLGDSRSAKALWRIWERGSDAEKKAAADALLQWAETARERGNGRGPESVYHRLWNEVSCSLVKGAALSGLAHACGEKAMPELLEALGGSDPVLTGAARDQLALMPGETVTRILINSLNRSRGADRAALVSVLAGRTDSAITEATPVLITIGREAVQTRDERLVQAVSETLAQIPGEDTTQAVIRAMDGASAEMETVWVGILGSRADEAALPAVTKAAASENKYLRMAALKALGSFGNGSSKDILQAALEQEDQDIRNAAAEAAIRVSLDLEKNQQKEAAIRLCAAAAQASTDSTLRLPLVKRLTALGATEVLSDMARRNGCIVHWWALGPVGSRAELLQGDLIPVDKPIRVAVPVQVKDTQISWKKISVTDPLGMVDLQRTLGTNGEVGSYLYAEIQSDDERDVLFKIGSNDDVFCRLNGRLVHEYEGGRLWEPDQDEVSVHLVKGNNFILMKVLNAGGEWAGSLRITDRDGRPVILKQREE
ncbi:MAG TPA: HEAT repeat domain-containing protein [bacterium]|nr:HEAT repeat domain-containing protein [bacterium]HQL62234.1 HEAT repeat domain-containing protein [bacterium]